MDHYYRTFDENRQNLGVLYQEQSLLTFQGERFQGSQAILAKLTGLAFQRCQHQLSSVDAQPSLSGGINVFVTGHLLVREGSGVGARRWCACVAVCLVWVRVGVRVRGGKRAEVSGMPGCSCTSAPPPAGRDEAG